MEEAVEARRLADAKARTVEPIRLDLPSTRVPQTKTVVAFNSGEKPIAIRGAERILVAGSNGCGKTTLVHWLCGLLDADASYAAPLVANLTQEMALTVPAGVLTQNNHHLDAFETVIDAALSLAPARSRHDTRQLLAALQLRKECPHRSPATLSGGQRWRVALARLLLAETMPQLLFLDEPTNNLDLESTKQLAQTLAGFEGALIVVTHDPYFAKDLQIEREWRVRLKEGKIAVNDVAWSPDFADLGYQGYTVQD